MEQLLETMPPSAAEPANATATTSEDSAPFKRIERPRGQPLRPICYFVREYITGKRSSGDLTNVRIQLKHACSQWREMGQEEKQKYLDAARPAWEEHFKAMQAWKDQRAELKRPAPPFALFLRDVWKEEVERRKEGDEARKFGDVSKYASEVWLNKQYKRQYEEDRKQYFEKKEKRRQSQMCLASGAEEEELDQTEESTENNVSTLPPPEETKDTEPSADAPEERPVDQIFFKQMEDKMSSEDIDFESTGLTNQSTGSECMDTFSSEMIDCESGSEMDLDTINVSSETLNKLVEEEIGSSASFDLKSDIPDSQLKMLRAVEEDEAEPEPQSESEGEETEGEEEESEVETETEE